MIFNRKLSCINWGRVMCQARIKKDKQLYQKLCEELTNLGARQARTPILVLGAQFWAQFR